MMIPELPGFLTNLGGAEYKGLIIALFHFDGRHLAALQRQVNRYGGPRARDDLRFAWFAWLQFIISCSHNRKRIFTASFFSWIFNRLQTHSHFCLWGRCGTRIKKGGSTRRTRDRLYPGLFRRAAGRKLPGDELFLQRMFYVSALCALGSVIILYNIKETLADPQKFSFKLFRIKKSEVFDETAVPPAIVMLFCVSRSALYLLYHPTSANPLACTTKDFSMPVTRSLHYSSAYCRKIFR
jgi:hypothetical protein